MSLFKRIAAATAVAGLSVATPAFAHDDDGHPHTVEPRRDHVRYDRFDSHGNGHYGWNGNERVRGRWHGGRHHSDERGNSYRSW